jgi:hypothetical protein
MSKAYTPPSLESQYNHIHPSHISPERLDQIKHEIAEHGVYESEISPSLPWLKGAVEVIEPGRPGGLLKIMSNLIEVPRNHPGRQLPPRPEASHIKQIEGVKGQTKVEIAIPEFSEAIRIAGEYANHAVEEMGTTHEALASFLQTFADAADKSHINNLGQSSDCTLIDYCGAGGMHTKYINAGKEETPYALLRGDMHGYRRPYVADEHYTIVNMHTGDELMFAYSDIENVRNGNYVQMRGDDNVRAVNPYEIGQLAGVVNPYGEDDPITSLTIDGVIMAATLESAEQIERFERLVSLGSTPCQNAQITFAPKSAAEMMAYMGRSGSEWIAPKIDKVVAPTDSTCSVTISKENKYELQTLLQTAKHWDERTQEAIFQCIDSIELNLEGPTSDWERARNIEDLIQNAIHINEDGSYTTTPSLTLLKRLSSNRYDFLEAVYKASDGLYLESSSQAWGEKKVTHKVSQRLDEQKASIYVEVLEHQLMETVDIVREALHIPEDLPPADQVVALLKNHPFIQRGMRLANRGLIRARPDLKIPELAEITMVIDRCRDADISDTDRAIVENYGLNTDSIPRYMKRAPGSTAEQAAAAIINNPSYWTEIE